jgi:hypothetical protein
MALSRRSFLAAGAGALVLAACGGGGSKSGGSRSGGGDEDATALVSRYEDGYFVPGAQRVAVSLGNANGLVSEGVPVSLDAKVVDAKGTVVVPSVQAASHAAGTPVPFFPFALTIATPGIYTLSAKVGGKELPSSFSVVDPSQVKIPKPGDKLPPFDTPTTADGKGVNPICTHQPPCALHEVSLSQALQAGTPVAYLIGTPAFCQTGVCAPILDNLLAAHIRLGDKVTMVHAEVYTDNTATTTTPAVQAYNMTFEPCLWITDASGTVVERLDFVFDQSEIDAALAKVAS